MPSSTPGSAMPSDRDRDTSGSPWSSPAVQNEEGPGFPVPAPIPAGRPNDWRLPRVRRRAAAKPSRPGACSVRSCRSSPRTSWRSSGWSSSSSWCCSAGWGRSSTTPTRPTPRRRSSTPPRTPRPAGHTCWAPTTPATTSSVASCSAGRTRSSWDCWPPSWARRWARSTERSRASSEVGSTPS